MRYPGGNGDIAPQPPHMIGPTWAKNEDGTWHLPTKTLGWGVLAWLSEYVNTPGGHDDPDRLRFLIEMSEAGIPVNEQMFLPTDEQVRMILWWYAVDERGQYTFREGVFRRLKGHGKDPFSAALALAELCGPVAFSHFDADGNPVGKRRNAPWITVAAVSQDQPLSLGTEVPTPNGWSTVGDLRVGDYVYGSDGQAHEIKRETEVLNDLDCYRVTFDDGTEVIASASHGWTTERLNGHGDKYESVTVTTEELAKTVRGSKNRKRHRIPVVGFESQDRNLLVDPWFLGLWLGDGSTKDTTVVFDWSLKGEYETLLKPVVTDFQEVVWNQYADNWGTFRIKNLDRTRDSESMRVKLRHIGVLGNKHIPQDYLLAGTEQRRELLRGMVDSDGGIDQNGRAYFVNANQYLVHQFQELAIGLGFRCTVRKQGKDGALRAEFNPGNEFPVSKLAYKYSRQIAYGSRNRSQHRWVDSVEKIPSVPVKCIGIDTEDHLFQVTRSRVLTHNTKNTFALFPVMISKKLKADYSLDVNRFIIYSDGGAGRIEAATSSPASMEGNRPTFVIQNETQWWGQGPDGKVNDGHSMASVIEGNMTKVEGARTLSICNAHVPGTDTVAEKAYVEWQDVQSGKSIDTGMMYDALEAPADTPVSEIPSQKEDPVGFEEGIEKLRQGLIIARGDSTWLPLDDIVKSILSTKNKITESRRKFLNQVNASEDSWLSPQEWDRVALVDPVFALQPKQKIALGFDGSKSNDWTALVACRIDDGMLFVIKVWNPEKFGGEVPREDVDAVVHSMFQRYDVVAFRADVKEFEAYVDQWGRAYKKRIKVNASPNNPVAFDMRGQQKRFAFDCERFEDAVLERELFHDGNPVLRQHVLNAKRHPTIYDATSIRKATKDSSKKIDAAVCGVLAFGARHDYLMSKKARTGRVVAIR